MRTLHFFRILKLERHWWFFCPLAAWPCCAGDSGVCFQTREQDVGIWEPLISALLVRWQKSYLSLQKSLSNLKLEVCMVIYDYSLWIQCYNGLNWQSESTQPTQQMGSRKMGIVGGIPCFSCQLPPPSFFFFFKLKGTQYAYGFPHQSLARVNLLSQEPGEGGGSVTAIQIWVKDKEFPKERWTALDHNGR